MSEACVDFAADRVQEARVAEHVAQHPEANMMRIVIGPNVVSFHSLTKQRNG